MKMKNNILRIFIILSITFSSAGCLSEAYQKGSIVAADRLGQMDDAIVLEAMIKGIPTSMMSANAGGYASQYGYHADYGISAIHLMTDYMLEDMTIGGNIGYSWFSGFLTNLSMGPEYVSSGYIWQCYYSWIGTANTVIEIAGEITEDSAAAVRNYVGHAYAYRAMCYLDLARLYEPKENKYVSVDPKIISEGWSVPIVTESTTEDEKKNNPRVTRDSLYSFIFSDLEKAENYIDPTVNAYHSPTLAAVYGLYARAYIELAAVYNDKEYYKTAAEYAEKAILKSGRTLLTEAQWHDPVNGFNNGNANNAWIWGLTSSSQNIAPVVSSVAHLSSEAIWAYGILSLPSISMATYNNISEGDFRKKSWLSEDSASWKTAGYKFAGSDEPISGNESFGIYNLADYFMYSAKPYTSLKFRPMAGACMDYVAGGPAEHPLMRVEEMYFIIMEATLYTKGLEEAKKLLEDFVSKRYVADAGLQDKYDNIASISGNDAFIKAMLFQKRVEFWGEGVLIFDYKRLNQGIRRGYPGTNFPSTARFNTEGPSPQWNLVIPRTEYTYNKGVVPEQNNPDPTGKLPLWTE